MPIVGMRIVSIEGRKGASSNAPNININSVPKVTDVKEIDLTDFKKKALAMKFDFTTTYEPVVPGSAKKQKEPLMGSIVMAGELIYLPENTQKVVKQWKKNKQLPENMRVEVLNHLFRTCLLRIATIAEELQLPLPLALPKIEPKKK